jgi:hypothetical protein
MSVPPPSSAPPSLPDTIAILSEIWNTNAAIPDNEYVLERIHAYVKTQLPQSIKNYQTAHAERETRKKSLELLADEITETFLNKTKYFYCPASELYFTYNNQVRYSVIHEDEIHHRILSFTSFTSSAPSTFGASADSVTISAPVSEAYSASAAPSTFSASASSAGCPNESTSISKSGASINTNESTIGAIASAVGCVNTSIASVSASISTSGANIASAAKYKIKNKIIKSIQSRDILSSIPESRTIQNVIGLLYPALFRTRDHAKYFLTILGDVLLKKSAPLIYFIPPASKDFIKDLGGECYGLFGSGSNTFATAFKFKYYEHQYKDCRIVDIHAPAASSSSVSGSASVAPHRPTHLRLSHMPELKSSTIDLFCVAAHYSHRFGCADGFLEHHCKTPEVATHAWFFRGRTEQQIINEFVDHSTEPASSENGITMPNMLYLWKLYLADFRLPSMIFAASLRSKLADYASSVSSSVSSAASASVSASNDVFPNRTSRYLPIVSQFRRFWGEQCFINETEIELEIDELSTLFNEYAGAGTATGAASDATLLGILRHFYPDVVIEDDKYILNVGCFLWDKKAEINEYLDQFKNQCVTHNHSFPQPLYNAYEYYCGKCYLVAKRHIISKRYFEKYFVDEYAEYLDENGMITIKWWIETPDSSPTYDDGPSVSELAPAP